MFDARMLILLMSVSTFVLLTEGNIFVPQPNTNTNTNTNKNTRNNTIHLAATIVPPARAAITGQPTATNNNNKASKKPTVNKNGTKKPTVNKNGTKKPTVNKNAKSMSPSVLKSISSRPSSYPSIMSSNKPSRARSLSPSSNPSNRPSKFPTGIPSVAPTSYPSNRPSVRPSKSTLPSKLHSDVPSLSSRPSRAPSYIPSMSSDKPSNRPSVRPSTSTLPSKLHSDIPSLSNKPSMAGSHSPSMSSDKLSNWPSVRPSTSMLPSKLHSDVPSLSIQPSSSSGDDMYYYEYYFEEGTNETTDDMSFDSYEVTTVNPGYQLFLVTIGICFCTLYIGFHALPGKFINRHIYQRFRRKEAPTSQIENDDNGTLGIHLITSERGVHSYHDKEVGVIERYTSNRGGGHEVSSRNSESFDNETVTEETTMKKRVWAETRKIIGLGAPWLAMSIIEDCSSIVTIMIISRYMGLREMICYSNVWFVMSTAYIINSPWYDTVYKHVNVSAATCSPEGYRAGALYLKIGVIGDFLIALPLTITAVVYMPDILLWIGYDESIAEISQNFAAIAAFNSMFDSTAALIDCVLDIEGHAGFTAMYEFWETVLYIPLELLFVSKYQPNLAELGLFHVAADVISTALYFIITGYHKRWFKSYRDGFNAPITATTLSMVKNLVKMTAPLTIESFMGSLEYTVLTIYAAYQGTAEAATWVLLSYVWEVVGIAPDSLGAAASCHVAKLLGKNEKELAKCVSWEAMKLGTFVSMLGSVLLLSFRRPFVQCFSLDDTIERMLYEIIPYIAICQPFFTICWTAMELNDALHLFQRAMVINSLATCFVVLPLGFINTYILHLNLEGLASAQCIGYIMGGVINVIFFAGADWDKASRKAQQISYAAKENDKILGSTSGYYDDYDWHELPEEAKAAATILGYNQHDWDNDVDDKIITDYDNFTQSQHDAATTMGYTRQMFIDDDTSIYDPSLEPGSNSSISAEDDLSLSVDGNWNDNDSFSGLSLTSSQYSTPLFS